MNVIIDIRSVSLNFVLYVISRDNIYQLLNDFSFEIIKAQISVTHFSNSKVASTSHPAEIYIKPTNLADRTVYIHCVNNL
jgi:hypothetical protein